MQSNLDQEMQMGFIKLLIASALIIQPHQTTI